MFARLQFLQDSFYSPVGVDEVGDPLGPHGFFPVHALLGPNLIGLDENLSRLPRLGRFANLGLGRREQTEMRPY